MTEKDYSILDADFLRAPNDRLLEVRLIDFLLQFRNECKAKGDYQMSDKIRNKLSEMCIIVNDTKSGTIWKYGDSTRAKKIWDDIRQGWYFEKDMRDDISEAGLNKWYTDTVKKIKAFAQEEFKRKNKKRK